MPTFTATARPAATPPSVELEIRDWTDVATATVERLDPDGVWRPVRTGEPASLTGGFWFGVDVEAPYGAATSYRAVAPAGTLTAGPVTLAVEDVWLVHPGVPSLSRTVELASQPTREQPVRRGIFEPVGRRTPIVVSQVRSAARLEVQLVTDSLDERAGLLDLLDDGSVLRLALPADLDWGLPSCWVSVGDVQETRTLDYGPDPQRRWSTPMLVVDRPSGAQQQAWSFAAVNAQFATFADVQAAFATFADLAANRRA